MATSRSNTPTPDDIELVKELTRLYEQALGISEKDAKARAETAKQAGTLNKEIKMLNTQMHEVVFQSDYLFRSFQDQTSELKNQNNLLNIGKSTWKGLTDIAQDLNYFQKGTTDLNDKQFKKLQSSFKIQEDNLDLVKRTLADDEGRYKNQDRLNKLQRISADDLSDAQKRKLKELTQEKQLLEAAQDTIKNGIPVLKNELNISKQIYKVKEDAGGLAKAAAGTISKYGGELSRFLKVDDAIESVNEYNKTLIDGALKEKGIQKQLIDIDAKRQILQRQLETGRDESGKFISKAKAQKELNNLEKESFNIKSKAIASVDNLGNKFNSLGILIKGLGTGIKKAITDPLTVMTFLIDQGLKANKQVTDLGKLFSVSYGEANKLREEFVKYSANANDTFITTDRLVKAQTDLSEQLGIAVQFSGEELATFSKLTEIVGLSAQEAGKLATFSAAAGIGTKDYVKQLRVSAFYANQANKTHFSDKLILQDISKLSAGILAKFQNNPNALAAAVVQVKRLGLSLEQVDKVGDSLLNWESSIENELKAQLLTGKQLNLEKARYLALTGSQAELAQEIANQAGSLADFNNMNVIAQKSLAEAFGMSRDELADMLMKQEAINTYGGKAAELNKEQLEYMKKHNLSAAEMLDKVNNQRSAQEKFNDAIDKLKDLIGNIVAGPLGGFINSLSNGLDLINKIFAGFAKIASAVKGIFGVGVGEALGKAASVAAIGGIGLLIARSLTKGTTLNPMIVKDASAAGGGGFGDMFGGGKDGGGGLKGGVGKIGKAFSKGGLKSGGKAIGGILKKTLKGNALTALAMGVGDAAINYGEGKGVGESLGRAGITGLTSLLGGGLGSLIAPGVGTIGGGIIGGQAGDWLGNKIFGESQPVEDGIAPKSKGPFTITDSFGATAITAKGDNLAVSPNINNSSLDLSSMINAISDVKNAIDKTTIAAKNNNLAVSPNINIVNQPINPTIDTNPIPNPNANFESTIKPNIAPPLDLTPFISAFNNFKNDVINVINRQQPTPQFALHVDGKQLGTVVGKQMETGTSQNIYTGYRIA
jgi:hypothetical protein